MGKSKAEQKQELKELALSVVRAQTNVYVKELLRDHEVRIGATKEDFDRNLTAAIENEVLTRKEFEDWLQRVEGWGEQHVYVYSVSDMLAAEFRSPEAAQQRVRDARLAKYWQQPTTALRHPKEEKLNLVSITYADSLRFHWHKGTTYWVRTKAEEKYDKPREWIEGFEYEFRAFRGRRMREVMRFEVRPADKLAALFIPAPIHSKEHTEAYKRAKATIGSVLDFPALERRRLRIGDIIRNLDHKLAFDAKAAKDIVPQSTRLSSGKAYVEFAAISNEDSYHDSDAVFRLRSTLRADDEIDDYEGRAGSFRFKGRELGRVELFDSDRRIRLWSSLTESDVWHILRTLAAHQ